MALSLYRTMVQIRVLEDELQKLCDSGEGADWHFSKGQEAISVGVCAALKPQDLLVVHHRMIGWAFSKGVPLDLLIAELLGKPSGVCGGRGGEMHMTALKYGLAHSFQIVGTVVPVAAGVAWALKNYKRSDGIVAAVFGDAATSNGQWHEGLNIAVVNQVPLLLVCENNHLAGNVSDKYYLPTRWVKDRASGYGIKSSSCDGNHVEDVKGFAEFAAEEVRRTSMPFLLECNTTRLGKHKQGQGDIRTKEEIETLARRDPLLHEEQRLKLDSKTKAELLKEVQEQVLAALNVET